MSYFRLDLEKADELALDAHQPPAASFPLPKRLSRPARFRRHLMRDVEPASATIPLASFCFMTGYLDVISFSAVSVWCAFQTGNTIQLSLALARALRAAAPLALTDKHALTSLLAFLLGAALARLGDRAGARTRLWLCTATALQAALTLAAAAALALAHAAQPGADAWSTPAGFAGLACMSASLGLQGLMGRRLNTPFATTIVLTSVWCELAASPALLAPRRLPARDHKLLAIGALFLGGLAGRALLDALGAPRALGVAAALRALIVLGWLWVPARK